MLPPKRPPRTDSPRSGLTAWLDRHAHPESRASRYFNFAHSVLQLLGLAGLPTLIVQLHEANIATRRDVYSRSVDAALLLHQLEFDHPDLICALEPNGPEHRLARGELEEVRYLEMNLHLHERLWQQHQDRIFDEEEWEPWNGGSGTRWSLPRWSRRSGLRSGTTSRRSSLAMWMPSWQTSSPIVQPPRQLRERLLLYRGRSPISPTLVRRRLLPARASSQSPSTERGP